MAILFKGPFLCISFHDHPHHDGPTPTLLLSFSNPNARQLVIDACKTGQGHRVSAMEVDPHYRGYIIHDIDMVQDLLVNLPPYEDYTIFKAAVNEHLTTVKTSDMAAKIRDKLAKGFALNAEEQQYVLDLLPADKKAPA